MMREIKPCWPALLAGVLWTGGSAAEVSTCQDAAARQEWQVMARAHAEDPDWQRLHALWLGLCAKVEAGDLSETRAGELFEAERERIIAKKKSDPLPPVERYLHPQG
jgi:hypothetical protein